MVKRMLLVSALSLFVGFTGVALAADQAPTQGKTNGSRLLTQQERAEYQAKMRSANSEQEREKIRNENHERMKERANARGK